MLRRKLNLVLLIGFCVTGFAQKNILKAGIIASAVFNTGLQYERSLSNSVSVSGQLGHGGIIDGWGEEIARGPAFNLEGRYYISKNKDLMEGFHLGIYLNYMYTQSSHRTSYDQNNVGAGLVGGYQWVFKSKVTLDTLLGWGYMNLDSYFPDENGWYPMIGLNLGYNF